MDVRDAAAEYRIEPLHDLGADEVPPGYKRTEVGVIPEDWDAMGFRDAVDGFIDYRGRTPRKLGMEWGGGEILALSANNVQMGHIAPEKEANFGSEALYKKWMVQGDCEQGDVLLTTEAPLGNVAQVPDAKKYILSQRVLLIKAHVRLRPGYLFHLMAGAQFQAQLSVNASGTTATGIQRARLELIPIPMPASTAEQEAIAVALSDAGALIESLQQLIAKQRAIKQGAMQALLTGRQRLPGFTGEWQTKRFDELFAFSGGFTASRDQLGDSGHCYLHYGDIHTSNKSVVDAQADYADIPKLDVALSCVPREALLADGDVVFVDASEDEQGASKHIVVANPDGRTFISGLHTIVAKALTTELTHAYRRYCFQTDTVKDQFRFFAVGTKVLGVSKGNIGKIVLRVPPCDEQTAIATVLSDMDAAIAALEARLAKTRALKAGMMQQLLTGRIRLVPKGQAHA